MFLPGSVWPPYSGMQSHASQTSQSIGNTWASVKYPFQFSRAVVDPGILISIKLPVMLMLSGPRTTLKSHFAESRFNFLYTFCGRHWKRLSYPRWQIT